VNETPGFVLGSAHQAELNRLALDVDVATSQEGKRLAALYKAGQWPVLVIKPKAVESAPVASTKPKAEANLVLTGIVSGRAPIAVVNGKTLAVGQTIAISIKPETYSVKCLKIDKDYVLVSVDGQERELHLK
jgi:type II secretory pathway component PulC